MRKHYEAGLAIKMEHQKVHRESFFIGGRYVNTGSGRVMRGQMYVEAWTPELILHSLPIILLHGRMQTAMNWMNTPDGRQGWADWFVNRGWRVYLIDQPARGRSAWQPEVDGPQKTVSTSIIERYFTATSLHNDWPQAKLHTQWPGGTNKGRVGDSAFDQYYAGCVSALDAISSEPLMQAAGAALLDRIGPAILLGHSQGGALSWLIGDARSDLVRAIIAVEPSGPPYKDMESGHRIPGHEVRPSGLCTAPLTFDPPVTPTSPIEWEQQQISSNSSEHAACWSQKGTPRRLVHLARTPVLVVTGEASYHALFDHCTARFLTDASVNVEHVRLADHGIHGNGHMMMLEKNNLEIALLIETWMVGHISDLNSIKVRNSTSLIPANLPSNLFQQSENSS